MALPLVRIFLQTGQQHAGAFTEEQATEALTRFVHRGLNDRRLPARNARQTVVPNRRHHGARR